MENGKKFQRFSSRNQIKGSSELQSSAGSIGSTTLMIQRKKMLGKLKKKLSYLCMCKFLAKSGHKFQK